MGNGIKSAVPFSAVYLCEIKSPVIMLSEGEWRRENGKVQKRKIRLFSWDRKGSSGCIDRRKIL